MKKVPMKYLPDLGSPARREMLDKIVLDILHGEVSKATIETATKLFDDVGVDLEDYDFIHVLPGGNPDNLKALNELALEELVMYLEGKYGYDDIYDV